MTIDELKAAAKRWRDDDYWWRSEIQDGKPVSGFYSVLCETDSEALADYAAAMLDETPITREWIVKLLGEADPSSSPSDAWWPLDGTETVGVYWDDDAWCLYLDDMIYFIQSTRADALAFFRLVRWPIDFGKVLEASK